MKKILLSIIFILTVVVLAAVSMKGDHKRFDTEYSQEIGGPYEASNSRGRYMLVQAIVDSGTFFLNEQQASFTLPDLAIINGRYVSIFTPGVTFLGVPFYILGKALGFAQLTTYALNLIVGIINVFLVYQLGKKLGTSKIASLIGGFLVLFGTNSLSYATTFTQHPLSAMLILLALINVSEKRNLSNNILLGCWFGLSVTIDIPNAVLFIPVLLYAAWQHLHIERSSNAVLLSINPKIIAMVLGIIPFIAAFAWYNHQLTGSYTAVPQLLGRSTTLQEAPQVSLTPPDLPFAARHFALDSRNLIRGIYTLVVSSERSWMYYSPFLVLGFLGLLIAVKKTNTRSIALVCIATAATNMVVYMMFGDPWGGWAFGPRYLIPAAAVFASGLGVFLSRYSHRLYVLIPALLICLYSIVISLAGAITTNLIPPKVEAVALAEPTPYTFVRNFQIIFEKNQSGSIVYNTYLKSSMSAGSFYIVYVMLTAIPVLILFNQLHKQKRYA